MTWIVEAAATRPWDDETDALISTAVRAAYELGLADGKILAALEISTRAMAECVPPDDAAPPSDGAKS